MTEPAGKTFIDLTATIVAAYVGNNPTPAAELPDTTPHELKLARLQQLQAAIDEQARAQGRAMVGTRQRVLVDSGASQTLNSRHIPGKDGLGKAVDLGAWVDDQVDWSWPLYVRIAGAMKLAAEELGVPIVCGIDWKMRDGPHHELDRKAYP